MKKYIFMAVAGMLALSSCSNDDNDQTTQNAPRQMTFTAGFGDGATTRATLDGYSVTFDAPDYISILSENNDNVKFTTSEGGATATFTGSATDDATYYAIYPYQDGLILLGTTIMGLEIPFDQSAAATETCGWDPAAPLAYATNTGTSFTFHNLCALLKVTNDKTDAVDITILDLDNTAQMTGHVDYDISTGTLTGGVHHAVAVQGVPAGKTVYIAIAPCTVGNLMAVCLDGGGDLCKTKASVTFEAGKIYNLGNTSTWTDPIPVP